MMPGGSGEVMEWGCFLSAPCILPCLTPLRGLWAGVSLPMGRRVPVTPSLPHLLARGGSHVSMEMATFLSDSHPTSNKAQTVRSPHCPGVGGAGWVCGPLPLPS